MNYEKGLNRLRSIITKTKDEKLASRFALVERDISVILRENESNQDPRMQSELGRLTSELDVYAYRLFGMAFQELCTAKTSRFPKLTLRGVLGLTLVGLVVPAIVLFLASTADAYTRTQQITELKAKINRTEARVGQDIESPFFLSAVNPCDAKTWKSLNARAGLSVTSPEYCTWAYIDTSSGKTIAYEHWQSDYHLESREYVEEGVVIAKDFFHWSNNDCFKQRMYLTAQKIPDECYLESGALRSDQSDNTSISPIPPMVYWFFYR